VPSGDLKKLWSYKRDFDYEVAIWLALPKKIEAGADAYVAVVRHWEEIPAVKPLSEFVSASSLTSTLPRE
jgi:hypothetical protein